MPYFPRRPVPSNTSAGEGYKNPIQGCYNPRTQQHGYDGMAASNDANDYLPDRRADPAAADAWFNRQVVLVHVQAFKDGTQSVGVHNFLLMLVGLYIEDE